MAEKNEVKVAFPPYTIPLSSSSLSVCNLSMFLAAAGKKGVC